MTAVLQEGNERMEVKISESRSRVVVSGSGFQRFFGGPPRFLHLVHFVTLLGDQRVVLLLPKNLAGLS